MKITGQLLKENREKQKLSVSEVSMATKISPRMLAAIEAGDTDRLPAKTFLRGFVRSYANYLKMDVDQVLNTFHEEMGSTLPEPDPGAQDPTWADTDRTLSKDNSATTKILAVAGIVLLIGLIIGVKNIVEKYEREATVEAPPDDIASLEPSLQSVVNEEKPLTEAPPAAEATETEEVKAEEPAPVAEPASTKPEPQKVAEKPKVENKPEPKPEPKQEVKPSPAAIAAADAVVPPPKPEPKPEVVAEPEKEEESDEPQASASNSGSGSAHEIIIEAFDKVDVSFRINGGDSTKVTLLPDQVHTIKAQGRVAIDLSDGGAVNIIHNGRDRGVPGDLGKPKKVQYP